MIRLSLLLRRRRQRLLLLLLLLQLLLLLRRPTSDQTSSEAYGLRRSAPLLSACSGAAGYEAMLLSTSSEAPLLSTRSAAAGSVAPLLSTSSEAPLLSARSGATVSEAPLLEGAAALSKLWPRRALKHRSCALAKQSQASSLIGFISRTVGSATDCTGRGYTVYPLWVQDARFKWPTRFPLGSS